MARNVYFADMGARNLKSNEVIVLATLSALVVQFTDLSGGYEQQDGLPWKIVLCFSSISPWSVSRLHHLSTIIWKNSSNFQRDGRRHDRDDYSSPHAAAYRTRFILHEVVLNLTSCGYHALEMPIFLWIAMLNYPLWFGQLDLAISNKERSLTSGAMSSKRPNKPKHDPLLLCGMVVYSFGCWARGYSYILSGSAMFPLAFPFTKRKFDSTVVNNLIPLSVIFLLEHVTIMSGMGNMRNVVHTVSHYVVHKMVNDLYANLFL